MNTIEANKKISLGIKHTHNFEFKQLAVKAYIVLKQIQHKKLSKNTGKQ